MGLRKYLHQTFYEPKARHFLLVNDTLAAVTLASIAGLVLETVSSLEPYAVVFQLIEYSAVALFTLEYGVRIAAHGRMWPRYVFSFYGFVDLVAIVPTYLGFTNLTFLKAARVFRIMQLLRILRITKLARVTRRGTDEVQYDRRVYRLTVQIYFFALFSAIILFGSLMYIFETGNPEFANIPLAMLFITKPLLGGVAQSEPSTLAGDITVVLVRFTGLVLFGLLVSVVGRSVQKFLFGKS